MKIIDISHHQPNVDFSKLKDVFIIHKCTQGTSYLDPTYNERKDKIQGSYHFADGGDPIKEADWYIKNSQEDFLCLDWEIEHKDPVGWCKAFINRVKEKTGKECWLYTNDARGLKYAFPSSWKKWIARYKNYTGELDWDYAPKSEWDMWQYTSRGKIDGIEGDVDMNQSKVDLTINNNKMNKDFVEIIEKITNEKLGDNINEKEQIEVAKKLKEFYEKSNNFQDEIETLKIDNGSFIVKNTQLEEKISEYETKIINQAEMLKAKDIQIEKLKENSGDLASASFMQLLKEIKNRIINY